MIDGSPDDAGKAPRDTKAASGRALAAANRNRNNVLALRERVRKMQQGMRSTDDIAQGIEALEAVAAMATSSRSSGKVSPQSTTGSSFPSTSSDNTSVSPSGPPEPQIRNAGRGMAALNKVGAGSRRVWEGASSVGGGTKDNSKAGSKTSRTLLRVSSGFLRHQNDSTSRSPLDGGGIDANIPLDSSPRARTEISSPSSTSMSPEHATLPRSSNNSNNKFAGGAANNKSGAEKKTSETKKSSSSSSSSSSKSKYSAHGRGFSSIKFHESFTPPSSGGGANGTGGLGERGSIHGRLKARGWWAQAHDKDASDSSSNKAQSAVGVKMENAELRLENRRLKDALHTAQVTD